MEHPPTYTLGLAGKDAHFLVSKEALIARGFAIHRVDRGGDVTFHGPGQLVGYPIMDMVARGNDIRRYVSGLETVIIEALSVFGLNARHVAGYPGVWIGERKIAAIGIRINAAGISTHGFAVNINTDLDGFTSIIPCGLAHKSVTSMAELLGMPVSMTQMRSVLADTFVKIFG